MLNINGATDHQACHYPTTAVGTEDQGAKTHGSATTGQPG